jgi:hypothetical protein
MTRAHTDDLGKVHARVLPIPLRCRNAEYVIAQESPG